MTERKLSLWLQAHHSSATVLDALIKSLSETYGGPAFSAHITLIPGVMSESTDSELQTQLVHLLECYTISRALSTSIDLRRQLMLQFRGIEARDVAGVWQSFIALTTKPDSLVDLHEEAKRIFGAPKRPPNPTYDPHVSLMYIDKPIEERRAIIKELSGKEGKLRKLPPRLGQAEERWSVGGVEDFIPSQIVIIEDSQKVEDWKIVARVAL